MKRTTKKNAGKEEKVGRGMYLIRNDTAYQQRDVFMIICVSPHVQCVLQSQVIHPKHRSYIHPSLVSEHQKKASEHHNIFPLWEHENLP